MVRMLKTLRRFAHWGAGQSLCVLRDSNDHLTSSKQTAKKRKRLVLYILNKACRPFACWSTLTRKRSNQAKDQLVRRKGPQMSMRFHKRVRLHLHFVQQHRDHPRERAYGIRELKTSSVDFRALEDEDKEWTCSSASARSSSFLAPRNPASATE